MDSMQRRKTKRQANESADELLEKALRQAELERAAKSGVRTMGEDCALPSAPSEEFGAEDVRSRTAEASSSLPASSGGAVIVYTPEQTSLSKPPSSPYSPHPFWSEEARAETAGKCQATRAR